MKKTLLAVFFGLFLSPTNAQYLISDTLLQSFTAQDLTAQGLPNIEYGVDVYKLTYNTITTDSNATIASGAVVIPTGEECLWPILSYQHGTILHRDEAPSALGGEIIIGQIASGSFGFITSMPDYLGFGSSPQTHPYVHSNSEASASVDMLRAAKEFCSSIGVFDNNQLFLAGYSQGGHATMALHKAIEENHSMDFQVTASAPAAGPYDVSGEQANLFLQATPYPAPFYLPYIILSYMDIYPPLQQYQLNEIFVSPYDTLLPPLFDGYHYGWEIDAIMPSIPIEILDTTFYNDFLSDSSHPFWQALEANNNYDWQPEAPVRMYYCGGDQSVAPTNSTVAEAQMLSNGATDVQAIEVDPNLDHNECAYGALFAAVEWAYNMVDSCTTVSVIKIQETPLKVYPNPAVSKVFIEQEAPQPINVTIFNTLGEEVLTKKTNKKKTEINLFSLKRGTYFISTQNNGQARVYEKIILLK